MIRELRIRANERITNKIFEITLEADETTLLAKIGQFFSIVPVNNVRFMLRNLAFIKRIDNKRGLIHLVYNSDDLKKLRAGERINLFGPLGKADKLKHLSKTDKFLLVAEGIGVSLIPQIREQLRLVKARCLILIDKDDDLKQDELDINSEIMTFYEEADLLEGIRKLREDGKIDSYLILTSSKLINSLKQPLLGIGGYISLHEKLTKVCGTGACYGCIIHSEIEREYRNSFLRICVDGPIFPAKELEGFNI